VENITFDNDNIKSNENNLLFALEQRDDDNIEVVCLCFGTHLQMEIHHQKLKLKMII